jgi:hypothetical protein
MKPESSPFILNILMISLALPLTTLGVKPEDAGIGYLINGDGAGGGGEHGLLNSPEVRA